MRWLHISDIHFGYNSATVDIMRKKLLMLAESIKEIDCLFITGDLRYAKVSPTDYPAVTLPFIQHLQAALKLTPEDTFVVPGNHDVNRSEFLQAGLQQASEVYSTSSGTISDDTLNFINDQRQPFLKLYKEICGHDEPGWHYCLQKNGFNIICLNTALFCCRDEEDGSLIVGSQLLNKLSKTVDSSRPGIVLAHHDFDSLLQDEQQNLEITLKEMGAQLYLCGHKHVALGHLQNTYRTYQDLQVFLCGTNMDKDPRLDQTDMDIFVGEVDETGRFGYIQAYKWNHRHHEWIPDIDFSYPQGRATDGRRYFPSSVRSTPIKPPDQNILEKYRQYIRNQCSEIELNGLPTGMQDITRKYAMSHIFVPLKFRQIREQDEQTSKINDLDSWLDTLNELIDSISLYDLIPAKGRFQYFILSDPGGGKTTLLKWLASTYCFPEEYTGPEIYIPKRSLFPVWIRCRDIPESNRLTVWSVIENIAYLAEWMPDNYTSEDFMRLVAYHIQSGTALLLIDGLDEIGEDSSRTRFIDQISVFVQSNPKVNVIVTSRITGFREMTKDSFPSFTHLEISPLSRAAIQDLCQKWYRVVYGEHEDVKVRAGVLARKIIDDHRLFRLARNPLMLTTLLLVERRVGNLPTKRAALYDEATQVLLETWNQTRRSYEKYERTDPDEAKFQLAYVAFQMMTDHTQRITKTKLTSLLRAARREFSDLISSSETISSFIAKIERQSALLIQIGYEQQENGSMEAIYEFHHLTFQEYLAAYAVVHRCYPNQRDNDRHGEALIPYLTDIVMKEVISLTAVLDRFCAKELSGKVLEMLADPKYACKHSHLRALVLQFIADEVQLKDDMVDHILNCCFEDTVWFSDTKFFRNILDGRYEKKLIDHLSFMDWKWFGGYPHWSSILTVLSGKITDSYKYYMDHHYSQSPSIRITALSVLSSAIWIDEIKFFKQINNAQANDLAMELLALAEDGDEYSRKEALYALNSVHFLLFKDVLSKYIAVYIKYINDFEVVPTPNIDILSETIPCTKIDSSTRLTDSGFQCVYAKFFEKEFTDISDYVNLLSLTMIISYCHTELHQLSALFSLVRKKYCNLLALNRSLFSSLLKRSYELSKKLQQAILLRPEYSTEKKTLIQEHILKIDLFSAQQMKKNNEPFSYSDCSLLDETEYTLTSLDNNSLDEAIVYITDRLKSIGCDKSEPLI